MYDSTSHITPGYRFQYQVPPMPPAWSTMRIRSMPALRSWAPATHAGDPAADDHDVDIVGDRVPLGVTGVKGSSRYRAKCSSRLEVPDVGAAGHEPLVALGQVLRLDGLGVVPRDGLVVMDASSPNLT